MKVHNVSQGSKEWDALRASLPTASEFSKLITSKGVASKSLDEYARTLAAEAFAGQPVGSWEGNSHTERGKELEPEAISLYELVYDVTVERVGFVAVDSGDCGCSPDGLVGDDGMVEIKCLMSKHHVGAILYYEKHGRIPTSYVQQTQGQMMICQRQWCDLVFYHPVLPLLVIREKPDVDLQLALVTQIKNVIEERDRVLAVLEGLR